MRRGKHRRPGRLSRRIVVVSTGLLLLPTIVTGGAR